jgi:hypothetical protein
MAYADDQTLLAPTAEAMRSMLKVCFDYATEFSICFNANKTKCMFFRPISKPVSVNPLFYINQSPQNYAPKKFKLCASNFEIMRPKK